MRHKGIVLRAKPFNLLEALGAFGKLKRECPEHVATARMGIELVRELQHLHGLLVELRQTLPATYDGYFDPLRLDAALARTEVRGK